MDHRANLATRSKLERLRSNVRHGAFAGLIVGLVFFVVGAVLVKAGTRRYAHDGTLISTARLFWLYVGGGVSIGTLAGALRLFARSKLSAIAIGVVCAAPIGIAAGVLMVGPLSNWSEPDWIAVGVWSVLLGSYGGWLFWRHPDV